MTRRLTLMRRLSSLARPVMKPLALSALCRILDQFAGIALLSLAAYGTAMLVTNPADAQSTMARTLTSMVVVALVKAVLRYLEQYTGHYVAFSALEHLRVWAFRRIWPQAPALSTSSHTGDILSKVTRDIDRIEVFFAHTIAPVAAALIVPVGSLTAIAVWASPTFALAALPFILAVTWAVPFLGAQRGSQTADALLAARATNSVHVTETVQGVRDIVDFGHEDARLQQHATLDAPITTHATVTWQLVALRRGVSQALTYGSLVVLTVVGLRAHREGAITLPEFAASLAAVFATYTAARGLEDVMTDLEKALASAQRLFRLTDAPPAVTDPSAGETRELPAGPLAVSFNNVSFTYPSEPGRPSSAPALTRATFDARPGTRTVIAGHSGAGKSTLAHLLLRVWDPNAGTIHLGGVNIRHLPLATLRSTVALVSQNTHLFNLTIAENLRLANPDATREELKNACRIACIDHDIEGFPAGYDTRVGEHGENISGGQRQRLALARALLSGARVLILDEHTSHLDETTATQVRASLRAAFPEITLIEITHRLRDAEGADLVLHVDGGILQETTATHLITMNEGPSRRQHTALSQVNR